MGINSFSKLSVGRDGSTQKPSRSKAWVQSPIAIYLNRSTVVTVKNPLKYQHYIPTKGEAILSNTGHAAMIQFNDIEERNPYLNGGILAKGDKYIFDQMHFHWGANDNKGSEHHFEDRIYAMEAHLVHYNEKYGDLETALQHKDGLVVVAFIFQASGNNTNNNLAKITKHLAKIRKPESEVKIDRDCLAWIPFGELDTGYFNYKGSLTTSNYNEIVNWIIYPKPLTISSRQVDDFRSLEDENGKIISNCRPIQGSSGPNVFFAKK